MINKLVFDGVTYNLVPTEEESEIYKAGLFQKGDIVEVTSCQGGVWRGPYKYSRFDLDKRIHILSDGARAKECRLHYKQKQLDIAKSCLGQLLLRNSLDACIAEVQKANKEIADLEPKT